MTKRNGLTQIMSELHRLVSAFDDQIEDVYVFGAPSECLPIVHRHQEEQVDQLFANYGIKPSELEALVIKRTSEKWYHCRSGASYLIRLAVEREMRREDCRQYELHRRFGYSSDKVPF